MGWGFRGKCSACDHEWEGLSVFAWVGPVVPGLDLDKMRENSNSWYCPRCYLSLSITRPTDRNSWRKWLETDAARSQRRYAYQDGLLDKLDQAVGPGKPYVPIIVEFHPGDCPQCHEPFEKSEEENPRLFCPQCRNPDAIIEENGGHYNVDFNDNGFR